MSATDNTGVCRFCFRSLTGRGMTRHLQTCAEKRRSDQEPVGQKKKLQRILHLKIAGTYAPAYWLHLEIDAEATFGELDAFLRSIWLECCGHLSEFTIASRRNTVPSPMSFLAWDMPDADSLMDEGIGLVLAPKARFDYTYDFGSSTYLAGQVMGEREGILRTPIAVLARNTPIEATCEECRRRPATLIDTENELVLCGKCGCDKDGEPDEMCLPLVNSPRTGVCGYSGEFDTDHFAVPKSPDAGRKAPPS